MSDTPPAGLTRGGLVTYLQVEGARKAAAFYAQAFGAFGSMPCSG